MQVPSSFLLCSPGVSQSLVPPRAVVLCSLLGLSINAFSRGSFFTPKSLADSHTRIYSSIHGQETHSGTISTPYSKGNVTKDETTWEQLISIWMDFSYKFFTGKAHFPFTLVIFFVPLSLENCQYQKNRMRSLERTNPDSFWLRPKIQSFGYSGSSPPVCSLSSANLLYW